MEITCPDLTHETAALAEGFTCVVGVDEVGRGPLAGPVTAAAVRLFPGRIPEGLNDSKKLTAPRREMLAAEIHTVAEVSIAQLFAAGIVPGILTALAFSAMIVVRCLVNPRLAPKVEDRFTRAEKLAA
ncbi:hypothetical protein LZ190_26400, partial [Rhodovulum sulfidophilum]|nr:hypothetical protein [Rhodovulum sulfidophilum]